MDQSQGLPVAMLPREETKQEVSHSPAEEARLQMAAEAEQRWLLGHTNRHTRANVAD